MKIIFTLKQVLRTTTAFIVLLGLLLPIPTHAADPLSSLISAFMGRGLGGNNGSRGDVISRPEQIIPNFHALLDRLQNNAASDNNGRRLQTQTATQIANYQEENQWRRERLLRNDEIARSYPEISNLSCALATVSQSAPIIDTAAASVTGQVAQFLSSNMFKSVYLNTELSSDYKAQIWCKLGATGISGTCETDYDLLVKGADKGHTEAITIKDSIPCDMPGVYQEFDKMKNPKSWRPSQRHKECIAAILSIANEFPVSNSLPTKEEASTVEGKKIWDRKINQIAMAAGSKGGIFEKFNERVSVPESFGCAKGIRGGGQDMYTLLRNAYGNVKREPPSEPSFGLPPSGFCISKLQFTYGQILMAEENERNDQVGNRNIIRLTMDSNAINLVNARSAYQHRRTQGGINTAGLTRVDSDLAQRKVASSDVHQEELLGAIRQLTREIQKMNTGVYANTLQEASVKKRSKRGAPASPITAPTSSTPDEISDAMKEMGIKVSTPAAGGVLPPITQEFPALPAQ